MPDHLNWHEGSTAMEPGVKPLIFGLNAPILRHEATSWVCSHIDISLRLLAHWDEIKRQFCKAGFPTSFFSLESCKNICKDTRIAWMILWCVWPCPYRSVKAPSWEEEQGQPGVSHCFSSYQISCRLRDFCSLGDTIDVVRLWNNNLSLPLSKGERRQWPVTNMVQSLPDHVKGHHRASHIPDAFLVVGRDRKWCLSYNGQGWDCETSCHST